MILTLIVFGIFTVGIFCLVLSKIADNKRYSSRTKVAQRRWTKISQCFDCDSWAIGIMWSCLLVGGLFSFICGTFLVAQNNYYFVEKQYHELEMEREALVYRLDHQTENIVGNELLYNDILNFNKKVYSIKYYHENPWLSWFNPQKLTEIEDIDYKLWRTDEAINND